MHIQKSSLILIDALNILARLTFRRQERVVLTGTETSINGCSTSKRTANKALKLQGC